MSIKRVLDEVEIDDAVIELKQEGIEKTWIRINNQSGEFEIEKCQMVKSNKFELELRELPKRTFQTPITTFKIDLDGSNDLNLSCIDSNGNIFQIGSFYGDLITFPKNNKKGVIQVKPDDETFNIKKNAQFMDITKVLILPSNSVSISLGSEGILKVWPIPNMNEKPARELKQGVNTFEIVGRGRNIITGCSNGSINIFELGSNELIWSGRRIKSLNDEVLALKVLDYKVGELKPHEKLFEIEDKIIFVGHKSGVISIWNLNNRLSIGEINTGCNSINSIEVDKLSGDILIGNSNGSVQRWKFNFQDKSSELLWETVVERNNEDGDDLSVNKILLYKDNVIVLTNNKLLKLFITDGSLVEQMIGFKFKLNDFCVSNNNIWTVGKYGQIFGYLL